MCRGFQQNERDHHRLLNIKAFYICLTTKSISLMTLPDSLTLYYLPRINGSPLEINGSKIRPHSPAFVTLHRLLSPPTAAAIAANNNNNKKKKGGGSVYFGSREPVKASQGARFEVYLREHKLLKGIFRKDWDDRWKMECSCGLDNDDDDDNDGVLQLQEVVKEAEVCVAAEGHDVAMREKVGMVVKRKTSCFKGTILEEIPEETECEWDDDCCCCCSSDDEEEMGPSSHFHFHKKEEGEEEDTADTEMEGAVSWAVDVGIWVMCLGVGFLVSSNTFFLRRRKTRTPFL